MSFAKAQAEKFVAKAKELGWSWEASSSVVKIFKKFTPGDKVAYTLADSEGYELLAMVPLKGGSIWGTEGSGIGGQVGLNNGYYKLNKSGENGKRFVSALQKIPQN